MRKSIIIALLAAAVTVTPLMAQQSAQSPLQDNAPDRYVVVPGDTLWSIAVRFLKDPWRWPEVWRLNREQIKNPHLLYPGDVIVLERRGPKPELKIETVETVKLEPRVRVLATGKEPIPSIPPRVIEPFLSRPLVIEPDGLEKAPRIVAAQAERVFLGAGDVAYVSGIGAGAKLDSLWQIYRQGAPLVDPDSRKTLGYEAIFLGDGRVTATGDPATIKIVLARQEIGVGDSLIAAGPLVLKSYVPHAPDKQILGRIIATPGGLGETGPQYVVTLNKGSNDGLEPGNVLAISRQGRVARKTVRSTSWFRRDQIEETKLPDERYGLVYVFRTFDHVSYALVMSAGQPVLLDDVVTTP